MIFYAIFYAALVSALLFWVSGHYLIKAVVVAGAFYMSMGVWSSMDTFRGWPSTDKPRPGVIIASQISAPTAGDSGSVYIWVLEKPEEKRSFLDVLNPTTSFGYSGENAPRGYRLPYTADNAALAAKVKKAVKDGGLAMVSDKPQTGGKFTGDDQRSDVSVQILKMEDVFKK